MKKVMLQLNIGILFLFYGCSNNANIEILENKKYVFTAKDTITYSEVMKHASNIVGVDAAMKFFGNVKIKGMKDKMEQVMREEGQLPGKREYSFLTDKQEKEWIAPLLPYELEIDSVFYLANLGKKSKITSIVFATATNRSIVTTSDLMLLTFNEKGEKIDGRILWPNIKYTSSIHVNNDTMITETTEYFFIVDGSDCKVYKGKKVKTSISKIYKFTKPDKEFSKYSLDSLLNKIVINSDGIISPSIHTEKKTVSEYYKSGNEKAKNNDYSGAIADYCKAIELDPKFSKPYYNRAVALSSLGNNKKAIDDYSKYIEWNPKDTDVYVNRAIAYFNMQNQEKACKDWKEAVEHGSEEAKEYLEKYCK